MRAVTREPPGLSLSDYVQMVWRRLPLVLVVTLAAIALATATGPPAPTPLYQATATLRVQAFTLTASGEAPLQPAAGVPPAEVEAARSVEVAAQTAEELGIPESGLDLLGRLTVSALEDTDLIQLHLTGEGRDTARDLQTYAANYVEFRNRQDEARIERALGEVDARIAAIEDRLGVISGQLEREGEESSPETRTRYDAVSAQYTQFVSLREQIQLDAALAGDRVEILGSPIIQRLGTIPTRTLRMIAGPIAGLLLGVALALALGVLRPRVTGRERTEQRLRYPVLATIPSVRHRRVARDPLLVQRMSGWGAEGIRMLRTELQLVEERMNGLHTVVVVSPEPRDGKTTVATNLAASYASAGKRTLLVRADVRARRRNLVRAEDRLPEGEVVRNQGGFEEVRPASPDVSLEDDKDGLVRAVQSFAAGYETVIVDTPPMLAFADALLLASEADAVVMVVRHGKTSEDRAAEALEVLARHDAAIAGLVLNGVKVSRLERYRYRRYYDVWEQERETESDSGVTVDELPTPETVGSGSSWDEGREASRQS